MVPRNQIFACVIKQYGTGLYQACVSFNKGHPIFLSAHHDEGAVTRSNQPKSL